MALDANGLTIRRLPEVLEDIVASEQTNIDSNISTDDDTLLGQLNNIIAAAIAEQEALAQAVYDNFNPLKAEGRNLDDLAALIGITRITAAKSSTTTQQFVGDNGVTINVGTILQNPINLDNFLVTNIVNLDVLSCVSAKYSVKDLQNNTTYTITVNSIPYSFLSDGTATELEILNGIEALITADATATWTAVVDTGNLQLNIATSNTNNIAISSTTFIGPDEVTNNGGVEAEVEGAIIAPPNSVTTILTSISGLTSTTNLSAYSVGRNRETDEELRTRLLVSQQASGVATVEAIQDSLTNVAGVTSATVLENTSILFANGSSVVTFTNATNRVNLTAHTLTTGDPVQFSTTIALPVGISPQDIQHWIINPTTNDFQISLTKGGSAVTFTDDGSGINTLLIGRPPKSFESIVQGGSDAAVALDIWQTKPAGIQTFGGVNEVITDSSGNQQSINFTRPVAVNLAFEIEYTRYDEESFPANGETTIAQTVLDFTNALGTDADVIPSRYFGDIYSNVGGIDSLVVKVQIIVNPGDTPVGPSFQTTRLPIDIDEFASVTSVDITVLEV
jgi:uncharacterized phage protein gp47/JayE